ncbi:1-acyl-sn-glycerol-3-phosphate acyltransferase [Planctomycetales bacterium]|nr:1-acyl-sn-glycerol-3-phosphate acyltransferase [Planctomycetales bacterium]GHT30898.1 1-acyl-sn-glycerol-3-phosphate acyltransferase [Planctomycetales bacterium]GHT37861.1 1-acyl-sn-glycerol-3-phosphate acyltransferase [Planctomycetales bacterium]
MNLFDRIAKNSLILTARLLSGATVLWYESQPDTCQRVYFANHTSHLDALVIWAALPPRVREMTRMVAAQDYWDAGPIRRYISKKLFNAILIERENIGIRNTPIAVMLREIAETYSLIIFPEGGRSDDGKVRDFKSGLYHLCKKRPDLELIPVYLNNLNSILPRGETLPVPMLSRVIFGPPIWLEMGETKDSFLIRARESVLKLKNLEEHYEEEPDENDTAEEEAWNESHTSEYASNAGPVSQILW